MFASSVAVHAQAVATPLLKSSGLLADAALLRQAYERLHPGLYRYATKADMDANFAALNAQLKHDQTLQEVFLAFSEFAAKVRCGHTQANPFNQSKQVVETLFKSFPRVPFYFDWVEGRMIVTRDLTAQHQIPRGSEVLTINGIPAAAILQKLLTIARADGANDAKRVAQLAVNGDSEYETFDLYLPLYFPIQSADMTLLVRNPDDLDSRRIVVKTLTFEQRIAPIKQREQQRNGGDDALFEWKYLDGGAAYLKMPTWALYNSKWNWKAWLNDRLDQAAERDLGPRHRPAR